MRKIFLLTLLTISLISCKNESKETDKIVESELTAMQKNLAKYVDVKLTSDLSGLTENERKMLPILIEAADKMNDLFWYEAYGDKDELLSSITDADTKKFVEIMNGEITVESKINEGTTFLLKFPLVSI